LLHESVVSGDELGQIVEREGLELVDAG